MYKISFKDSVRKDLKRIDKKYIERIFNEIILLELNPFPVNSKKLIDSDFYRLRVGNYRIIYLIDFKLFEIIIFYIRHRNFDYKF